jgi:DNA replication protein DnaC
VDTVCNIRIHGTTGARPADRLRVMNGDKVVAEHRLCPYRKQFIKDPAHYAGIVRRQGGALERYRRQFARYGEVGLRFLNGSVVVFIGPPGVGKTHLAAALGLQACGEGYGVLFRTARRLMRQLRSTQADDSLDDLLRKWDRIDLLIVDELGYLSLDKRDASLLFQLVNHRYERGALIVTTNVAFSSWDDWLGDSVIAGAILDRLLHHATIVAINGESYRMRRGKPKDGDIP